MWMILGDALMLVALGTGIGLVAALGAARVVDRFLADGFLYEVSPSDPVAIGVALLALGCVAAVAAFIPAHRAATVGPIVALRHD